MVQSKPLAERPRTRSYPIFPDKFLTIIFFSSDAVQPTTNPPDGEIPGQNQATEALSEEAQAMEASPSLITNGHPDDDDDLEYVNNTPGSDDGPSPSKRAKVSDTTD
jgi:hypothetical protein